MPPPTHLEWRSYHAIPLSIDAEPDVGGHQWPAPLPGDEALLFVIRPGFGGNGAIQDGRIAVFSRASHEYRVLIEGAHRPQYVPTGHIAFVRAGSLWAVPFDAERLEITGPEVPVIDDVQQNGQIGGAAFAFSDDGLLAYLPGSDVSNAETGAFPKDLVWADPDGREEPLAFDSRAYWSPQLSPNGRQLATDIGPGSNVWINDLERGTSSRLTFSPGTHEFPHWTPDGQRVLFWSARANGQGGLFWQPANGTGQPERLTTSADSQYPTAVDGDRGELIYTDTGAGSDDIHALSLQGAHASRPLLTAPFNERSATISPDGRWLAYESDETGNFQIFVRPYPNVDDGRWPISSEGGTDPHWGLDASELFFMNGSTLMAVRAEVGDTFLAGTPKALFTGNYWSLFFTVPNYDLAPDGRFLMMRGAQATTEVTARTLLLTVENWFDELERLAPPAK